MGGAVEKVGMEAKMVAAERGVVGVVEWSQAAMALGMVVVARAWAAVV